MENSSLKASLLSARETADSIQVVTTSSPVHAHQVNQYFGQAYPFFTVSTISLLETTVTSVESDLQEKTEEWQGALKNLWELIDFDNARLQDQLAALIAEKMLSVLLALCSDSQGEGKLSVHSSCHICFRAI